MSQIARKLRKQPTPAEIRFWRLISPVRTRFHFRKQVAMGPYVVDFASHAAKLVVEIDGDTHFSDSELSRDQQRDAQLTRHGYQVLRFTNLEVMCNPDGVYRVLVATLEQRALGSERRYGTAQFKD